MSKTQEPTFETLSAQIDNCSRMIAELPSVAEFNRVVRQRDELVKALQKISDLIDTEAGDPLDDAISIANAALAKATP